MKLAWMNIALIIVSCYHAQCCQVGQEKYGSSCYQLLDLEMTWDEANTACSDMGGGMVVPDTEEERQFIWEMFTRKFEDDSVWIGCTDREEEGKWMQAGGKGQECSYFNWATTDDPEKQPDNAGLGEDCVELRRDMFGYMNDNRCPAANYVICEFTARSHPTPEIFCLKVDANGHFTLK